MTINEIHDTYQSEWVLIVNPQISPGTKIIGGDVILHSKDRNEIHRRLSSVEGDQAIIYTGKIPEDVGVLL
jgi:hypothetical protein